MAFVNGGNKEVQETLVCEIKPGKRREFEMVMKASEWKMNLGKGRVTRSKNGVLECRVASENVLDDDKSSKKRKIDVGVFDEGKDDGEKGEVKGEGDCGKPLIVYTRRSKAKAKATATAKGEVKGEVDCVKPLNVYTRRSKAKGVDQMGREDGKVVRETENSQLIASSDGLGELGVIENDGRKDVGSSGKVELKSPTRLKELLETGLLEGLPVKYIKGPKARVAGGPDFLGQIRGTKIMCYCKECRGDKAFTPNAFEVHAGSGNKRPADYIYLDNGRSLRDVMNLCKGIPADMLEQAIQGSLPQSSTICLASGESSVVSPVLSNGSERPFSRDISEDSLAVAAETCSTSGRSSLPLPSPKTVKLSSSGHSGSKVPRLRTMKDLPLHKLVFESPLLPECHLLKSIPQGKWCCLYSDKEKRQAKGARNRDAGSTDGVDSLKEIEQRRTRIVQPLAVSETECFLCRQCHYSDSDFGPYTVIFCDQCEREYHVRCLKDHGMDDLKELPAGAWFCSKECRDMRHTLTQLVDVGEQTLPQSMLSIIRKKRESIATSSNTDLSLTWRLIHAKSAAEEHREWLSGAVSVFRERFRPIYESSSDRKDLIPIMAYGGDTIHQDYCGMYCATLILNSKVVSAGIFRIFGQELAEIPLVATGRQYQSKGFFQCLFSCIVDLLSSLGVKEMVLPAATEAEPIWKRKFGFEDLSEEQLDKYQKDYRLRLFEASNMLHKPVPGPKA